MAVANAQEAAAHWAQGLSGAAQRIKDGAMAVTVAPGQAAARQAAVWQANTVAAAAKWQKNVAAVPLQDWQNAMVNKGADRVATGAQAAQPKFEQFMNKLLPAIANIRAGLPPRGNYEQNKARAVAMMDGLHKQSFK